MVLSVVLALNKARDYIAKSAKDVVNFLDYEVLVYLISRGVDAHYLKNEVHCKSRQGARQVIDRYEMLTGEKFESVSKTDNEALPNFWIPSQDKWSVYPGKDKENEILDATMLRVAQACVMPRLGGWWDRIGLTLEPEIYVDEVIPLSLSIRLFSMSRSAMALQRFPQSLKNLLHIFHTCIDSNSHYFHLTWKEFDGWFAFPYSVAAIGFVEAMLNHKDSAWQHSKSIDAQLLESQNDDGSWPVAKSENGDIATTSIAIHALTMRKPKGYKRAVRDGARFLVEQQHEDGSWRCTWLGSDVWLTVLVIDALELSLGKNEVTFPAPLRCSVVTEAPNNNIWYFKKSGDHWIVGGKPLIQRHLVGMDHIAVLLKNPNTSIPVLDPRFSHFTKYELEVPLSDEAGEVDELEPTFFDDAGGDDGPMPVRNRKEYEGVARLLRKKIVDAEVNEDAEELVQLKEQLNFINAELKKFGGRNPSAPAKEKARKRVRAAITKSIREIEGKDSALAEHLKRYIRPYKHTYTYEPPLDFDVQWVFRN